MHDGNHCGVDDVCSHAMKKLWGCCLPQSHNNRLHLNPDVSDRGARRLSLVKIAFDRCPDCGVTFISLCADDDRLHVAYRVTG